jgi:hypothetical protein
MRIRRRACLELRSFFSESVNGPKAAGMSLLTLKRLVKKMIEEEDGDQAADRRAHRGETRRRGHSRDAPHRWPSIAKTCAFPSTHQRRVKS